MSAGVHRLWKRFTLALTQLRPGQQALDVAGGTGDLSAGMAHQVGNQGLVVLTDINAAMLARGRDRLIDEGLVSNVRCLQANAEKLPFADDSFHCVTIGFGPAQCHGQGRRAALDAPGSEARWSAHRAGVLAAHGGDKAAV